ncbi:threonylcarbamoyl-AMP synthase [Cryobacterium sp. TMT1-21]|uniref:L-threonylcarbamoyladenylate synthase n=1 Tax=Cryobacterium shii TaxID=1259235 RepID=A0AAQ2C4G4_9MICO|nr:MULTISPECIES: L-threonylcarbamoyladenylate synthase [Cryobacterium]TFC42526.1 threonylcarbamoyl-AMP synthase [Cryobacterium shii]TFC80858.1 threonylcarbamoyl-AMP synthase [Cryobacterium sp. TmT2-59]TFD13215.1 threonylcarbamoyl-AMP synthase [Cryobacterium sp. TMT1-21]TFD28436.1 threonylcarbamoyl-AMP synthase [Cryobacterium sp. TMT2-23]TFD36640.1 threonylcarbamoyl-AMP synthase [Cryobacterium sp. TMT2-10]
MTRIYDCSVDSEYAAGMRLARSAIGRGALVVIPTDTVYGLAADAFSPEAVQRLLDAKGRDRTSPPPVLIPGIPTLDALAQDVPPPVRELVAAFWPGGLTVVLTAQPSLVWDLGETRGTVALRMPSNRVALDLLAETGPLAVSSANMSGLPAAIDAIGAEDMLGINVAVYLDGGVAGLDYEPIGDRAGDTSSTIVDATGYGSNGGKVVIVRNGVISRAAIEAVIGDALAPVGFAPPAAASEPAAEPAAEASTAPAGDTAPDPAADAG